MTQALLNLVMNAHTHTPPGTPITVDAVVEGDHLAFRVIDQGPGIEPALLPTVFDPFVTTKTKGAGRTSGLGLTVAKAVTEAQGGTVEPAGRTERRFGSDSPSIRRTDPARNRIGEAR